MRELNRWWWVDDHLNLEPSFHLFDPAILALRRPDGLGVAAVAVLAPDLEIGPLPALAVSFPPGVRTSEDVINEPSMSHQCRKCWTLDVFGRRGWREAGGGCVGVRQTTLALIPNRLKAPLLDCVLCAGCLHGRVVPPPAPFSTFLPLSPPPHSPRKVWSWLSTVAAVYLLPDLSEGKVAKTATEKLPILFAATAAAAAVSAAVQRHGYASHLRQISG